MGYDLHITRAENWFENEGFQIAREEWDVYVKSDAELEIDNENEGSVNWNSALYEKDYAPWYNWFEGNISTKNPEDAVIVKMFKIAVALNARVQGDDGEFYFLRGDNEYFVAKG